MKCQCCRQTITPVNNHCPVCGFSTLRWSKKEAKKARRRRARGDPAMPVDVYGDPYNFHPDLSSGLARLWIRDNGICHLCKGMVRIDVERNHPLFPSRDHVKPRSSGGTLNSKALAHSWCNSRRGSAKLTALAEKPIDFKGELEAAVARYEAKEARVDAARIREAVS